MFEFEEVIKEIEVDRSKREATVKFEKDRRFKNKEIKIVIKSDIDNFLKIFEMFKTMKFVSLVCFSPFDFYMLLASEKLWYFDEFFNEEDLLKIKTSKFFLIFSYGETMRYVDTKKVHEKFLRKNNLEKPENLKNIEENNYLAFYDYNYDSLHGFIIYVPKE